MEDNDVDLPKEDETTELEIFDAFLKDNKVYIEKGDIKKFHEKGYYGNLVENRLELEPIEAVLLLERKRLSIKDENKADYDFRSLAKHFVNIIENFWIKYLIYRDLRIRGYIVRPGYGDEIEFRVYDRGAVMGETTAKYLIVSVVEGKPLKLSDLSQINRIAKSSRKKLVLVVVDRQGEPTYYQCKQITL